MFFGTKLGTFRVLMADLINKAQEIMMGTFHCFSHLKINLCCRGGVIYILVLQWCKFNDNRNYIGGYIFLNPIDKRYIVVILCCQRGYMQ